MNSTSNSTGATIILCVEDEQDLLEDIAEELTDAGYRAETATSGDAALRLMDELRPALVLCDISMPGLDGFDVLDRVKARGAAYADIPFVFLTALSDPREIIEGKRAGADDYLVKPIDYDLLLATVETRLREVARIHDAQRSGLYQVDAKLLCARHGLTPAEARVAVALTEGGQSAKVAKQLGISRTTVAFHTRNIYAKTGTNRQAELVALLLRTAARSGD